MPPDRLPDEAFVVRGGLMDSRGMRTNAEDHHLEKAQEGLEEWAISVWSAPALEPDAIVLRCPIPHGTIQVSTVGAIRVLGCDVVRSEPPPLHADLMFPSEPTEGAFEGPASDL
jgi:hypothetical protein